MSTIHIFMKKQKKTFERFQLIIATCSLNSNSPKLFSYSGRFSQTKPKVTYIYLYQPCKCSTLISGYHKEKSCRYLVLTQSIVYHIQAAILHTQSIDAYFQGIFWRYFFRYLNKGTSESRRCCLSQIGGALWDEKWIICNFTFSQQRALFSKLKNNKWK